MILMIDNYDSFVYNLYQYFLQLGEEVMVARHNEISLGEIATLNPGRIVISPGPCSPDQAGISLAVVRQFAGRIPILGVCLGHQTIGQAFGGRVIRAVKPMHGKESLIHHDGLGVFAGLPQPLKVGRYHSLAVDRFSLPKVLKVTATSPEGEIMGLRHALYPVEGVQFHPESVLSEQGHQLLQNFVDGGRMDAAAKIITQ